MAHRSLALSLHQQIKQKFPFLDAQIISKWITEETSCLELRGLLQNSQQLALTITKAIENRMCGQDCLLKVCLAATCAGHNEEGAQIIVKFPIGMLISRNNHLHTGDSGTSNENFALDGMDDDGTADAAVSGRARRRFLPTALAIIAARRLSHARILVRGLDGEIILQLQVPRAENMLQVKERVKVVSGRPTERQDLLMASQERPLANDLTVGQARKVRELFLAQYYAVVCG